MIVAAPVLGILEAGENRPELTARHGTYVDFFKRYFGQHDGTLTFKAFAVFRGELPIAAKQCDGYIVTGSRHSAYDDFTWIADLKAFVRDTSEVRPVLGICFGHQIIAEAFGGEVAKSPKGWGVGIHDYAIYESRRWMDPRSDILSLIASHQDQVTVPPPAATVLAGSAFCPIGMMEIGEHILTLQSHPEMTKPFAAELYAARRKHIGEEQVADAVASLEKETNEDVAAEWLLDFFYRDVVASATGG